MTETIRSEKKISQYLDIVAFSKRGAQFTPAGAEEDVKVLLKYKGEQDTSYELSTQEAITSLKGMLTLQVLSMQFRFEVELQKKDDVTYQFVPPEEMNVHDLRKYPRLQIDPTAEPHIQIRHVSGSKTSEIESATFDNISATGLAFFFPINSIRLKTGDEIVIRGKIFGRKFEVTAKVHGASVKKARCEFTKAESSFQKFLHDEIQKRLEWTFDIFYEELKAAYFAAIELEHLKSSLAGKMELKSNFLELVNPVIRATVSVFSKLFDITPERQDVKYETISTGLYDVSAEVSFRGQFTNGSLFLGMKMDLLHSLVSKVVPEDAVEEFASDFAGEIINIIAGNAKEYMSSEHMIALGAPTVISGKEHVVAVLSQYKVVRINYSCGDKSFDINIFMDDLVPEVADQGPKKTKFVFDEKLINPIIHTTENLFNEFLGLKARKLNVQMKDKFVAKFETSAIVNIFSEPYNGKILVNFSDKLAFRIHEILLDEPVTEVNESVKDALGEMVNTITGNSKAAFSKEGWVYQLSIPYVIRGRDHIITTAGKAPFISCLYNTDGGFFEICFTLIENIKPG